MREPRHTLYLVACAGMFVFGMVLALPGTVLALPDVVSRFELTLATRGLLISALFLGLLGGSFVSGPLVDAAGHRRSLAVSALLIAASLPLFTAATGFTMALGSLAAIGLACAGLNTASNALSSDFFPEERGRRMNLLAIAVGLGGLTLPALTALTARVMPWWSTVLGGAVLAAAVGGVSLVLASPVAPGDPAVRRGSMTTVMRQPGLIWIALLVMLGAGNEASMAGFTSTYLTALGFEPRSATWALSAHWVGLIVGRIAFGGLLDRGKTRAIVLAALGSAAAMLLLVTASAPPLLGGMPFVVGVTMGIIMPTALALGGERYPRSAGTLFGLLLTVAQAGAMMLPALIGVVAEALDVRAGMATVVLSNVAIAAICARVASLNGLSWRRRR